MALVKSEQLGGNMDRIIRQLENDLLDVLNKSIAPIEAKRVVLALLAKDCELKVNSILVQETITEEGEMKDGK